ncbi:MAG TPA: type VI secretion system membrane subunit TssM, partial [Polyangiaceae bacterium]|nr:type VI secretion system membrane subunit TssM [Polyangiaceae bacterium]
MWWLALALVLVTGLTWLVIWLLHAPWVIAIVVTATLVVAFFLVLIFRRVRAEMRASALEKEIMRAAAQQAQNARPDRRNEVLALQGQMKAAIQSLRRTKLGKRGGASALYALPWYVVVGPPKTGKTTALTQSGLGFITPPGAGGGGKFRGTAGTRNCDWWFSEQAILLDTAGRFTTGEDDREEWLGFLDMLRRFRPSRPLDGVVMAVSVDDLLGASEIQLEELAATLRSRADEVMERLEMVLPLYLMLTKVDLVAGFVEFWGDLGKNQRGQTWGATFELADEESDFGPSAAQEFDRLEGVLYARMLGRLGNEPLAEVRARVLQFPLEFAAIRRPLLDLVEQLAKPNPYQETPLLRGFYLTSGTQTGRAIDRVLEKMARGFNVPLLQAGSVGQAAQPQSYFVTELFQRVIFPDRHLAVRSQSRLRRRARRQAVQAAIVAVVVIALVVPAAASYVDNSRIIHDTSRDMARSLELERTPGGGAAAAGAALDLLVSRVQQLEEEAAAFSIHGYLGPYTAPELIPAVKRVYLERLRATVHGPVRSELAQSAHTTGASIGVGSMDSANFQQAYEDLKLYLMLGRPEHLDPAWATPALARVWARALRSEGAADQEKLLAHARYFVTELAKDKSFAIQLDDTAVARAQGRLAAMPVEELRYGWLLDAAKGAPPIRPDKIFLGPAAQYSSARPNVEVPGPYTALGWQKVRPLVESPDARFELEPWVLGQAAITQADTRAIGADRLRELYFQRYTRAWSDFIDGLGVIAPTDLPSAIDELRVLSQAEGPYTRLFNVIGENVRLDITPPQTLADLAKQKMAALADSALAPLTDGGPPDGGAPARAVSTPEREFQPLLSF